MGWISWIWRGDGEGEGMGAGASEEEILGREPREEVSE